MNWLDRQNFLGADSRRRLESTTLAIVGLGGGGSHVAQQAAHLGIGRFQLFDPDFIDETNLNRLVGGTVHDVRRKRLKVQIARRTIQGVNPGSKVAAHAQPWQLCVEDLAGADLVISCLDLVRAKAELDSFCRRMLIPLIDIGMDVTRHDNGFLISGQVVLSAAPGACLRCFGVVTELGLAAEARRYGDVGGRPQVVWPNGTLASIAVGLAVQIICPWHPEAARERYLEYDGNLSTVRASHRIKALGQRPCIHHSPDEVGTALFVMREPRHQKQRLALKGGVY